MEQKERSHAENGARDAREDRIIALSDGVFAIAITLLVLDIQLPDNIPSSRINAALLELMPKFISYTISFFVVAIYWTTHRRMMGHIRHVDGVFIWINLLFLFFIAFLPVPTNFLGRYDGEPPIVIFYTLVLVACGFTSFLLWLYAVGNHRLVDADLDRTIINNGKFRSLTPTIIFLLSLGFLWFPGGAHYSLYVWWLIPVVFAIQKRIMDHRLSDVSATPSSED